MEPILLQSPDSDRQRGKGTGDWVPETGSETANDCLADLRDRASRVVFKV